MEQVSKCYRSLGAWADLSAWKARESQLLELERNPDQLRRQMLEPTTARQAACLDSFAAGETLALQELSDWRLLDEEEPRASWSCARTMVECSNSLVNIALRLHAEDGDGSGGSSNGDRRDFYEEIERCRRLAARTMQESLRNVPSECLSDAVLVQYAAAGLEDVLGGAARTSVFELSEVRLFLGLRGWSVGDGMEIIIWCRART